MGAVSVVVLGIVVVVGKVPAVNVINVAVSIIVNPVARDLAWVCPHLGCQVWVLEINAPIQDGDDDGGSTRAKIPGLRSENHLRAPLVSVIVVGVIGFVG